MCGSVENPHFQRAREHNLSRQLLLYSIDQHSSIPMNDHTVYNILVISKSKHTYPRYGYDDS